MKKRNARQRYAIMSMQKNIVDLYVIERTARPLERSFLELSKCISLYFICIFLVNY